MITPESLAALFAVGFAIQRLIEAIDPLVTRLRWFADPAPKKTFLTWTGILIGIGAVLASGGGDSPLLLVVKLLKEGVHVPSWLDVFVTGLVISAGTEGLNSVLKFAGYKKEEAKGKAVVETKTANVRSHATEN
jgi:hypothetical protein